MAKEPEWFPPVRDFCREAKIKIMGWGPEALVIEAKSPEVAAQIANQLGSFGLTPVIDTADAEAGMLTLSRKR
jgi:hypothetical protein